MNKKGTKNTRELSEYAVFSQYEQELDAEIKQEKERLLAKRIPKRDMDPNVQKELNSILPSGHYLKQYGSGSYFDDGKQVINPYLSVLYFTTEYNERASLFVITKLYGAKTYADIKLGLGSDPHWAIVSDGMSSEYVVLDSGDRLIQVVYANSSINIIK